MALDRFVEGEGRAHSTGVQALARLRRTEHTAGPSGNHRRIRM